MGLSKLSAAALAAGAAKDNFGAGAVIATTMIRYGTRMAIGSVSAGFIAFSGTFTKQKADSIIIATCNVFGSGYASGNCGVGLKLDSAWDYGVAYQYDGAWSQTLQTVLITGHCQWSGIAAGSHTIGFGWNPINGASGEKPFDYLNPNNTYEPRNQQMVSSILVHEVTV